MTIEHRFTTFAADEEGAITVDWTVLSAIAVAIALAATAVLTNTVDVLSSRMDDELRTRSLGDEFVEFHANHFADIIETGYISEEEAQAHYDEAADDLNHDILNDLEEGIAALEDGTITPDELVDLVATASVAEQRNLVDDATLDYYFGFGGSDPYYATAGAAIPATTG